MTVADRRPRRIDELVAELGRVDEGATYYALTLTAGEDGKPQLTTQTQYAGAGSKRMWEMRVASPVHPHKMRSLWRDLGQRSIVVNSDRTLAVFVRIGGNAIVEEQVFTKWFSRLLVPKECVPSRSGEGVRTLTSVEERTLKHAPTPKMRMDVIRRDGYRCRVCGQSPDDDVNIVLHVHHVRPWGDGGLTEMENLLTLCHTCHTGLDPHFEFRLLSKIPGGLLFPIDMKGDQDRFGREVTRYRESIAEKLAAAD